MAAMSGTSQPRTVYGAGVIFSTGEMRSVVPAAAVVVRAQVRAARAELNFADPDLMTRAEMLASLF